MGKNILDSFGDYNLNLEKLKNDVKDYYKIIKRDLDIKDDNTWRNVSVAKPKEVEEIKTFFHIQKYFLILVILNINSTFAHKTELFF